MAANPSSSIIFFLLFTLGYFITKYYVDTPVISGIYFLTLIIVQFFINLNLTSDICNESQYGIAMTTTVFPWVFMFGFMVVLLKIFPNWLSPFSNTFGYLFTYITGVNDFLMEILNNKSRDPATITKIYENKSLLINSITLENITDWWKNMLKDGILKPGIGDEKSNDFKKLEQFIKLKTNVAEFIWYVLTGILVTSTSYNYILNSGCTQSAEEMERRHDEYLEQEKKLAASKKEQNKNKIIYKTYE
jgi:hypothetical protein